MRSLLSFAVVSLAALTLATGGWTARATTAAKSDVTLTVIKAGDGTGTVSSRPGGIACGSTCSHAFPEGTIVNLGAGADEDSDSVFAGWSGACSGTKTPCQVTMDADTTVTATFVLATDTTGTTDTTDTTTTTTTTQTTTKEPPPQVCVVPKVTGKTLTAAKSAIKKAHCAVGKVTKKTSAKVKKNRVISQKPSPGKKLAENSKVSLVVSKGKKH